MSLRRTVPILALLAALLLAGCGGGGGGTQTTDTTDTTDTTETQADGERPPLDPSKTYKVVVQTNKGSFTITLDQKTSPNTTASFVSLVEKGFYDGLTFHRIIPGFVIQGGDPSGDGTGGPGYTTVDTPPADAKYTKGVVAMAKTQAEAPGTAGSQFFVVTGDDAGLPPDYAILGTVTDGMDVVEAIGQLGDPATEQPTEKVEIEKATVEVSG
jgi:cyclophilin family peptidyl-prolyl cis-trans isomerase